MKKLINEPEKVILQSLAGMAEAHSDLLTVNYEPMFIARRTPKPGKVALVSGGGSGHEPLHGGYVGLGMLDAACPGQVFTSPTPDQMEAAAKAVDGGAGVLFIVKNYTGDVMNFDMAAEILQMDGMNVEQVVINDDAAVEDSLYTAGRRGTGVTVIAEKICGAAAERGDDLAAVTGLCRRVNAAGRSMGMALTSCTVPEAGRPTFEIADDEMEMGVGIHGEPGRERMKLKPTREIVEAMAGVILDDLPFVKGDQVIALVNGLGASPLMELYLVYNELARICRDRGVKIVRNLVGNYITSLEMAGMTISLVRADQEMIDLWDAPVHTAGLRWGM